ncbi:MAG: fibronectin type III domain-containing protein [Chloroflexi bacterium]|nr:MAG: fibronectin type III domain-containing protein [Chloroflexota bacterium]
MGNFETVNGVRFLSAWNTRIGAKIETRAAPGQPDYMIIDEMFIDAPAFQRQRTRARFQGKTTLETSDVLLWSTHHDPTTNATHEFPLASTAGCDIAAGTGLCTLIGGVPDLWRIKYDVDYRPGPVDPKLFPCPQLKAEPRFGGGICPVNGLEDNFSVMSPITHETHARTGNKVANPNLVTIDLLGNPATNGQYLFPMGMGLGGIEVIDFAEVNPGLMATPISFSGIPWNLDRRLSPGGCIGACEATPQPLDPFPFEGLDPRTQAANVIFAGAGVPSGAYNDPTFTASPLTNDSNRILSFVDPGIGNFNGDKTILAWPPANPPAQPIVQTAGSVTAPGTPTGVVATLTSPTQATVTFTPPAANGGSAITGYVVTALINGVLPKPPIGVFVAAPATSASVGGLTSGTTYTFIVSASNGTGTGGNSVASNSVTPAAPAAPLATAPGAPTGVTATASNAQASVSFTAPASDGGSPITSYTVTSSPAGGSATVSAPAGGGAPPTTATVTGLTNGTAFTFTVTASNAAGTSPASAPSNSVTPTAPPATVPAAPGAPVQSIATPSKLTVASPIQNSTIPVTLNWSASSSSGITSYQLQQSTNGGAFVDASVQPTGTATSATVTPPMGTLLAYQFQVRACSNPTTCSAFAVGPKFRLVPVDDNIVANIAFRGGWTVAPVPGAYGGSVHFATKPGANATLNSLTWTVVGNGAWVSTLGPDRGKATVTVDGGPPTIIDLYAPTQQPAQVVWTLGNLGPGTHTVVVTVQGAQNPASTGSRVDVDAFVVII